jgi:hypothetical protein
VNQTERFAFTGFLLYQTQVLQKSVPEHRNPPPPKKKVFECAPLLIMASINVRNDLFPENVVTPGYILACRTGLAHTNNPRSPLPASRENLTYNFIRLLEIHVCNNPSPVFKRCILSAVASTSSQGVCQVR